MLKFIHKKTYILLTATNRSSAQKFTYLKERRKKESLKYSIKFKTFISLKMKAINGNIIFENNNYYNTKMNDFKNVLHITCMNIINLIQIK